MKRTAFLVYVDTDDEQDPVDEMTYLLEHALAAEYEPDVMPAPGFLQPENNGDFLEALQSFRKTQEQVERLNTGWGTQALRSALRLASTIDQQYPNIETEGTEQPS